MRMYAWGESICMNCEEALQVASGYREMDYSQEAGNLCSGGTWGISDKKKKSAV